MPYIAVRCPTCAGEIQLDDTRDYGFCLYCGGKVIYKEAVQKMILSGSVMVQSNIEPMLKSADGFLALGQWIDAMGIYRKVISLDSTDYRGWWGLYLAQTCNLDNFDQLRDYTRRYEFHDGAPDSGFSPQKMEYATNAIKLAPSGKKAELDSKLANYLIKYSEIVEEAKKWHNERRITEEIARTKAFEERSRLEVEQSERQAAANRAESRKGTLLWLLGALLICAGVGLIIVGMNNHWPFLVILLGAISLLIVGKILTSD